MIDRLLAGQVLAFREDDGNSFAAFIHHGGTSGVIVLLGYFTTRQQTGNELIAGVLTQRHAFNGHRVGNGPRRKQIKTVVEHLQTDFRPVNGVVAMGHGIDNCLEYSG